MSTTPIRGVIENLDIGRIHPPNQILRADLGPLQELIASIMENGLLQPILVRHMGSGFEVVAGHRRYEACKRLNMRRITCNIVELNDKEAYEVAIVENIQRKTFSPLEEARIFHRYINECGHGGVSELARKIGKSPTYVSRRVDLLSLENGPVEPLLRGHKIGPSVAQELLSLDEQNLHELTEQIGERKITRAEVRRFVRQHTAEESEMSNRVHYDAEDRHQRAIERSFGRCITSLQLCMGRFDDVLECLEEGEWLAREVIIKHRGLIHQQIDEMMKLRKRMKRAPRMLWGGGA